MAQTGFLGCWKCGEISVAGELEELPIGGLSTPVYCCAACAGDLCEAIEEQPLTIGALHAWGFAPRDELHDAILDKMREERAMGPCFAAPALTGSGDPSEPRRPMIGIVVRSAGEELFRTGEFVASSVAVEGSL